MLVVTNLNDPPAEISFSYSNILSARVNAYYKLRPMHREVMVRYIRKMEPRLPDELVGYILEFCVPETFDDRIEQLILLTPIDKIMCLLHQRKVNLDIEYAAIIKMRDVAATKEEGDDIEIGRVHFDFQYGSRSTKQLIKLIHVFKMLPSEILRTSKVKKAFVTKQFIEARHQIERFKIENLTEFDLGVRFLYRIPSNLQRLVNLRKLILSNNYLTFLPPEIGTLINLKILDLSHNLLTTLPKQMKTLINLEDLCLSDNQFTVATVREFWKYFSTKEIFFIYSSHIGSYFYCLRR